MTTYQLRQVDLGFNVNQPRDQGGRWSLAGALLGAKVEAGDLTEAKGSRVLTRTEARKSADLQPADRVALFEAAGLTSKYSESDAELASKYLGAKDPKERADLEEELAVRQKALVSALSVVHEAQIHATRNEKRANLVKFDAKMSKSKIGRAFLKIRDKIVADGTFDFVGNAKDKVKEFGKEWSKVAATEGIVKALISGTLGIATALFGSSEKGHAVAEGVEHAAGEVAKHVGGNPEIVETLTNYLHNPAVETGLVAAAGLAISLGVGALRKRSKRKQALKITARAKLAPTHKTKEPVS